MKKRGDIWISAVLYMALGIVVLTIVLAAGLPVIQKMKDRQTLTQTKNLMNTLDQTIRTVYNEGPSSKRTVELKIGRGRFQIFDKDNQNNPNTIHWELETKALLSEPDTPITEGTLTILTTSTSVKGKYIINLDLNYNEFLDIIYDGQQNVISGKTKLQILNKGPGLNCQQDCKTRIQITPV
jgi:type II secretory pathway pseudopilin PulG